jgi:predicted metal-dependent phosphoesterase TrpH
VHTRYSSDGHAEPRDVVLAAKQAGLRAIAVVDHNEPLGALEVERAARGQDLLVVRGIEVSSFNGHILALGVSDPIPRGLSANETIRRINDHGGLAVAAHPGRLYTGLNTAAVRASSFRAVEVANGHSSHRQNRIARRLASDMGVGMTGGSDAHWVEEIGTCRTVFETEPTSTEEVLEAIHDRRTRAVGDGLTQGEVARLNMAMLGRWARRGGRRL